MPRSPAFDTLIHLRIPFSFFLLPIFLFAVSQSVGLSAFQGWAAFFIVHFLLYPASHAFNTWYDKDEGSVGGIKTPPPVHKSLFWTAWVLDVLALAASFALGIFFGICMAIYTLGSKLYSWDVTRFKKRPIVGWLGVGVIQGALTFVAVVQGLGAGRSWSDPTLWFGTLVCAVFLWGVYPLTQIYQHEEDAKHGDLTISRLVGIRGTFVLSAIFLTAAVGMFVWMFQAQSGWSKSILFLSIQTPTMVFFLYWAFQSWVRPQKADFRHTMIMNLMASGLMNVFFLLDFWP